MANLIVGFNQFDVDSDGDDTFNSSANNNNSKTEDLVEKQKSDPNFLTSNEKARNPSSAKERHSEVSTQQTVSSASTFVTRVLKDVNNEANSKNADNGTAAGTVIDVHNGVDNYQEEMMKMMQNILSNVIGNQKKISELSERMLKMENLMEAQNSYVNTTTTKTTTTTYKVGDNHSPKDEAENSKSSNNKHNLEQSPSHKSEVTTKQAEHRNKASFHSSKTSTSHGSGGKIFRRRSDLHPNRKSLNNTDPKNINNSNINKNKTYRRKSDLQIAKEAKKRASRRRSDLQGAMKEFKSDLSNVAEISAPTNSESMITKSISMTTNLLPEVAPPAVQMSFKQRLSQHTEEYTSYHSEPEKKLPERKPKRASSARRLKEKRGFIFSTARNSNYVVKNIPKTQRVKLFLKKQLENSVSFQYCSEKELIEINKAFASEFFDQGDIIIQDGCEADRFFVLEKGIVDVYDKHGDFFEQLKAPASFGDTALLFGSYYNRKIIARSECKCWFLRKLDFRTITSQYKLKRMQFKIDSIRKVKIADKVLGEVLDPSNIDDMALATRLETFRPGDVIIREGEKGDIFYMIEEGTVDVYKKEFGDKSLITLSTGNFFGEKALLNHDDVRQATCVATSKVKCLFLMREDFVRMLGNLQDLLDSSWMLSEAKEQVAKVVRQSMVVNLEDIEEVRKLGSGAYSTVKLVKVKQKGEFVTGAQNKEKAFALKCIKKNADLKVDFNKLHKNEIDIMRDLDENPFIIRFHCELREEDTIYFLLDACLGGDLFSVLHRNITFPEDWSRFYAASVVCAFDEIHSKRIAFRDLKPENLIMDTKGYLKVIDFGLSKKIKSGKAWTLCGTLDYLSPEVILNEGHDWAVDYWALGVLIFEMVAGFCPFTVLDDQFKMYRKILSGNIDIPAFFGPRLADLVKALLRKDPSKRLGKTKGGAKTVKHHRWFAKFRWDSLMKKKIQAPYLPAPREGEDLTDQTKEEGVKVEQPKSQVNSSKNISNLNDMKEELKRNLSSKDTQDGKNILTEKLVETDEKVSEKTGEDEVTRCSMVKKKELNEKEVEKDTNENNKMPFQATLNNQKASPKTSVIILDYHRDSRLSAIKRNEIATAFLGLLQSSNSKAGSVLSQNINQLCKNSTDYRLQSFSDFSLFSVDITKLKISNIFSSGGKGYLDPLIARSPHLFDYYPRRKIQTSTHNEIATFCMPNGMNARLIPKCSVLRAYEMGLAGPKSDFYQLHVFTDVHGTRTFGVSVTTKEIIERLDIGHLQLLRLMRRSVVIISSWWYKMKKEKEMVKTGSNSNVIEGISNHNTNTTQQYNEKKRRSFNTSRHKMESNNNFVDFLKNKLNHNEGKNSSIENEEKGRTKTQTINGNHSNGAQMTNHVKRLAESSYKTMKKNEEKGEVCIVDKCYVLIGIRQEEQALLFNALQSLLERERSDKQFSEEMRHLALEEIQDLSLDVASTQDQNIAAFFMNKKEKAVQNKFKYEFSPEVKMRRLSIPVPLPQIGPEWGIATLFLRVKATTLVMLLKLLLLERSVLIIGTSYEEVTSCCCALLELLKPFKWVSVFMPILSKDMLDFVFSPVPYIAGTVVNNEAELEKVENDERVRSSVECGLSILNISLGKVTMTEEDGIRNIVSKCFTTAHLWDEENKLNQLQIRLKELSGTGNSSLASFKSFFQKGASSNEKMNLVSIKHEINYHLSCLPSALANNYVSNGWRQFGEYDDDGEEFNFHPGWYIESARYQLQFEERLARTQLFVTYLEEKKNSYEMKKNPKKLEKANVIAKWLYPKWKTHRNNKAISEKA